MENIKELERYVAVVPTANQKAIEKMGFYTFIHFGMNTFYNREWGNGKEDVKKFNPTALDTDQWCEVIKASGAKGVIFTAKHHDGFCLWQTDTTEHSIKNSPYKNGKGDIVAELAESCRKYGLKMGVYLSPWDRHSEYYGTPKYDDFYCAQLTELLTNYGEIFTVWLDGACGAALDGKSVQKYDFDRYYKLIRELQPNCAISNCGPDVRWCGNEAGCTRESEWNVVPAFNVDAGKVMENSQQSDGDFTGKLDQMSRDLGSRKVLAHYKDLVWYPAEVDVSIRKGWFYHKSQDKKVRSVDNLLDIYYRSAGGNCTLLLNIPPDTRGLIADVDAARLKELGASLNQAFARPVTAKVTCPTANPEYADWNVSQEGTYSPQDLADSYEIRFDFPSAKVDKMVLVEDIDHSQRVETFRIETERQGKRVTLYEGTTIGHKRIALFERTECDNIILNITGCRLQPYLESAEIYESVEKVVSPVKLTFAERIKTRYCAIKLKYIIRIDRARV